MDSGDENGRIIHTENTRTRKNFTAINVWFSIWGGRTSIVEEEEFESLRTVDLDILLGLLVGDHLNNVYYFRFNLLSHIFTRYALSG